MITDLLKLISSPIMLPLYCDLLRISLRKRVSLFNNLEVSISSLSNIREQISITSPMVGRPVPELSPDKASNICSYFLLRSAERAKINASLSQSSRKDDLKRFHIGKAIPFDIASPLSRRSSYTVRNSSNGTFLPSTGKRPSAILSEDNL